jgi:hypothetical protein
MRNIAFIFQFENEHNLLNKSSQVTVLRQPVDHIRYIHKLFLVVDVTVPVYATGIITIL